MESNKRTGLFVIVGVLLLILLLVVIFRPRRERGDRFPVSNAAENTILRSFTQSGGLSPTESTDPCSLLIQQEVEEELGMRLGESLSGYEENPLGERFCHFPDPQAADRDILRISIVFNEAIDPVLRSNGFSVSQMFEGHKASPELIQLVDDLGTAAFWGGSGFESWNGLHILAHDVYIQVDAFLGDEELSYRASRNMGVLALERLLQP